MKIVFSIKSVNLAGGSERTTISVAEALAEQGHDVSIVSFTGKGAEPFFSIDNRIKRYYLSPKHDRWPVLLRECRRIILLRRLYAQLQPDVIVAIGATRAFVNIPASKGYPMVVYEYFSVNHRAQLTTALSRRLSAKYADTVITLSEYDAEVYRRKYGAKKAVAIPNPPTLTDPQPSTLQNRVVLGLGRITKVKGFDLLLDAWRQIGHTDWELHIVGNGRMKKKLMEKVKKQNINGVCFFPATSDVASVYRKASIFVLSSRSEGFGNVLVEAMSVGLPVVSFDCGAGPRDIIIPGVNGIFVPPGDTVSMAKELDSLMADTQRLQKMGNAARESVKRFDTKTIIAQWEKILTQVRNK